VSSICYPPVSTSQVLGVQCMHPSWFPSSISEENTKSVNDSSLPPSSDMY
jgi:hypothetical protein